MKRQLLTDDFIEKYKNIQPPMTTLGEFVYYRTYSRFLPNENRREHWYETVRRAVEYNCSLDKNIKQDEVEILYDNMFNLRQFVSGRTMWVGGTDVSKNYPMANFNCAFQVIDNLKSFSQLLYLLMLGTGVGVRVLAEDVDKLPLLRSDIKLTNRPYMYNPSSDGTTCIVGTDNIATITVGDSKDGWSEAMVYYFDLLRFTYVTEIVINYDRVRPQGYPLKTFGGTASGHQALETMFTKIHNLIQKYSKDGKVTKLKPIDCLDIANIIGEGVVVGGVRRTAEIILFGADDVDCIKAKDKLYKQVDGNWIVDKDLLHRQMSNNSIYYKEKPTREQLHWQLEKMRYSGEPAWVNETAGAKRRKNMNGVNPCGEILLDAKGMCNLTTVNVMAYVENGTLDMMGLMLAQVLSARSGFRMTLLDLELDDWNNIHHRDNLVGCSLTGWQDMVNALKLDVEEQATMLRLLKIVAKTSVETYAKDLGVNPPLLVTTIKPEGTISQLPTVSSGVHYSHSPYYVRRVRVNSNDAVLKVCEELGYPIYPEVGQDINTCTTKVVEFPVKAPKGLTKHDVSAIQQLENYKLFMEHYVEHNCSITVHVRDNEWEEVEEWVWNNWDDIVAVSFISLDDNFYQLLPYEAISKEEYESRLAKMKPFNASLIAKYETGQESELTDDSCANGVCPIR